MKLKVNGQSLKIESGGIVSEGAVEFASFVLECDESWKNFVRTVRFRHTSSQAVYDVAGVTDGAVYYIPAEVLTKGNVFVSVLGVSGGVHISTTELASFFVEGSLDEGKTPVVTEDAYAQYVHSVKEYTDVAKEAKDKAISAQNVCEELAGLATVCEDNCEKSVQVCADFATLCERTSNSAAGAELSMQQAVESVRESVNVLIDKNSDISIAENERAGAEYKRAQNEKERETAENERCEREEARSLAEAERILSEKTRILADSEREARLEQAEKTVADFSKKLDNTSSAIVGKYVSQNVLITDAEEKKPIKFSVRGKTSVSCAPSRQSVASVSGVGELFEITLEHRGKNIIPYPYLMGEQFSKNGVEFTAHEDGSITAKGASEGIRAIAELTPGNFILPAGSYVVSGGSLNCIVCVYDDEKLEYLARSYGDDAPFTIEKDTRIRVRAYVFLNREVGEVTLYPMLRRAGTSDKYTQYFKNAYTIITWNPLYSISGIEGNIYDEIVLTENSKEPEVITRTAMYEITGEETVELIEEGEEYNTFSLPCMGDISPAKTFGKDLYEGMGVCSHLPYGDSLEGECIWMVGDKVYMKLDKSEFPSASQVINYIRGYFFSGESIRIIYPLAEEIRSTYDGDMTDINLAFEVNEFILSEGDAEVSYTRNLNAVYETIIDTLVSLDARLSLLEV